MMANYGFDQINSPQPDADSAGGDDPLQSALQKFPELSKSLGVGSAPSANQTAAPGDSEAAPDAQQPEAPVDTKDYANMPWSDVATGAAENFLPSSYELVKGVAKGVNSAIAHPIQTSEEIGSGLSQLGGGLLSKAEGAMGYTQDESEKAENEAALNKFIDYEKSKYGSIENFKKSLYNNPADIVMDASMLATGGEGLVAKAAGEGTALAKAAGALAAVPKALDPLNLTAQAASIVAKPLNPIAQLIKNGAIDSHYMDGSGELSPNVQKMAQTTFGGSISADDLNAIAPEVAAKLTQKGLTPETLREAVLESSGMKSLASTVSGTKPPLGAEDAAGEILAGNAQVARERLQQIMDRTPVSGPALGDALDEASAAQGNEVKTAYDKIGSQPGQFDAGTKFVFPGELQKSLTSFGLPDFTGASQTLPQSIKVTYPGAIEALDLVRNDFIKGNMPGGNYSLKAMMDVRKGLNEIQGQVGFNSQDGRAIEAVKQAFDNTMNEALKPSSGAEPLFSGGNPNDAFGLIADANAKHRAFAQQWTGGAQDVASKKIASSVKDLITNQKAAKDASGFISPQAINSVSQLAQNTLIQSLKDPKAGAAIYDRLAGYTDQTGKFVPGVLKDPDHLAALNATMRHSVLNVPDIKDLPKNISGFLTKNKPLADRIFPIDPKLGYSPEQAELSRLSNAVKMITAKGVAPAAKSKFMKSAVQQLTRLGITATAGHLMGGWMHGLFMGYVVEPQVEKLFGRSALKAEMAGAPISKVAKFANAQPASAFAKNIAKRIAYPIATTQQATSSGSIYAKGGRIGRKSGGKVSSDPIANKRATELINMVDKVRKAQSKHTSSILNLDDSTVVHALAKANEAI